MSDAVSIIRQLKIDLITDTPNTIIDWFNEIWSRLYIIETDVYHNKGGEFIYYDIINKKQCIFFQDNEHDRFWCSDTYYWSILETKFNINYNDAQDVTKLLVENALNNYVATPETGVFYTYGKVDNALNNVIAAPTHTNLMLYTGIENAMKKDVATPIGLCKSTDWFINNALKRLND